MTGGFYDTFVARFRSLRTEQVGSKLQQETITALSQVPKPRLGGGR